MSRCASVCRKKGIALCAEMAYSSIIIGQWSLSVSDDNMLELILRILIMLQA